jgi:hypothetical protein
MTAKAKAVAKARRIHNAQHAKAVEIAPVAVEMCRRANTPADKVEAYLGGLPDEVWLAMAAGVGKAGRDGTDAPSNTTRGMVIDLVAAELSRSQIALCDYCAVPDPSGFGCCQPCADRLAAEARI